MTRRGLLVAGVTTGLLSATPALAGGTRRSLFGLQDGTGTAAQHVDYGSLRLWDAGVSWRSVELQQGVYTWSRLDSLVDHARSHGIKVTLVLGDTPVWLGERNSPPPPDAFRSYVTAVMARYRGRISTYSAWNEVNGPSFWAGTPAQMKDLCRVLAEVRDVVDPSARLLSPSFQTLWKFQRQQLQDFLAASHRLYDAVGVSLYPQADEGPEGMYTLVRRCRDRMDSAGCPAHMPLWGTEVNYGVTGGNARLLREADQAANVMRTWALAAVSPLDRLHWYRWDWGLTPDGEVMGNTYLTRADDRVTPTFAGRTMQTAMDWLAGDRRPSLRISDGVYRVSVRTPTTKRVIVWCPADNVRIPRPPGARRLHRLDRSIVDISGQYKITVGPRPKMIVTPA